MWFSFNWNPWSLTFSLKITKWKNKVIVLSKLCQMWVTCSMKTIYDTNECHWKASNTLYSSKYQSIRFSNHLSDLRKHYTKIKYLTHSTKTNNQHIPDVILVDSTLLLHLFILLNWVGTCVDSSNEFLVCLQRSKIVMRYYMHIKNFDARSLFWFLGK